MSFSFRQARGTLAAALPLMLSAGVALAQEVAPAAAAAPTPQLSGGDTAFILISSMLVLMMLVPGLALFYGGMVRKKNVLAVLMQSFFGAGLLSLIWVAVGYSLTFTEGNAFIGGFSKVMLNEITPSSLSGTIPEFAFVMFQLTFAIITPVIILGGSADRMKFSAAMIFISLWLLLAYVPVAHMVWGPGGFMASDGVLDFAGGTVVHVNSGIAGLVAALMVGKRKGFGTEHLAPHNLVLTMIGGSLLWVGWFGFNGGSALSAGGSAATAVINSQIAAAAALVSWTLLEWVLRGKPSLLGAASGMLAGLVVITPACGFVTVSGAMILGLIVGPFCYWGVSGFKKMFGFDDALDVWGIHGMGGILGAVLTGVFAVAAIGGAGKSGLIDGNAMQVWVQAKGTLLTLAWSGVVSVVVLKLIDWTIGLRVSKEVETEGLDFALHGETIHD